MTLVETCIAIMVFLVCIGSILRLAMMVRDNCKHARTPLKMGEVLCTFDQGRVSGVPGRV